MTVKPALQHFKPGWRGFIYKTTTRTLKELDLHYWSGRSLGCQHGKIAVHLRKREDDIRNVYDSYVIEVCEADLGRSIKHRDEVLTEIALRLDQYLPEIAAMFDTDPDAAVEFIKAKLGGGR